MKQSDKQGLKTEDQVVNTVRRLVEGWEQRDASDGLGIFQRYVECEFHLLIHFRLAREDYVAFFERGRGFRNVEEAINRPPDTPFPDMSKRDEQSVMFVGNIHCVDEPEKVAAPSTVRLGSVNGILGALRHQLYFSMTTGYVTRSVVKDREFGTTVRGFFVDENKLIGEVIKGTSEVMRNVPSDESDVMGRRLEFGHAKEVVSRLRVSLGFNDIRLSFDEPVPSDFQVKDVLSGPFDL